MYMAHCFRELYVEFIGQWIQGQEAIYVSDSILFLRPKFTRKSLS